VHRDLLTWRVRPPLSEPGAFPQLEVVQVADVGDETVPSVCSHELIAAGAPVGLAVYALRDAPPGGPFDVSAARRALPTGLYSGRLAQRWDGSWLWLASVYHDDAGRFVGELADPIPFTG